MSSEERPERKREDIRPLSLPRQRNVPDENGDVGHPGQPPAQLSRLGRPMAVLAWTCLPPNELAAWGREYQRVARRLNRKRGPGRPLTSRVQIAVQLRREGKPWSFIYPRAIPDYWKLDKLERHHQRENLRRAARPHLKKKGNEIPPNI